MVNQQLLDYIKEQLQQGVNGEQIKQSLLTNGWQSVAIEEAFNTITQTLTQPRNLSVPNPVKAYNPRRYDLIGLFFSLIPVFIMSFANSKVFSNGETIRKRIKISLTIFIVLVSLASVSEIVLFSSPLGKNIVMLETTALSRIPFFGTTDTMSITRRMYAEDYAMFEKIQNYIVRTFLILHFILLVWVIRFTNKHEWPAYQALKEVGQVKSRLPLLPLGIGVIVIGVLYFGQPVVYATVLRQVYRLQPVSTALNRNPSATPSPVVSTKTSNTVLDVQYLRGRLKEFWQDQGRFPSSDDDYLGILGLGLASSGWTIEPPPPGAKFYLTEEQVREMHKHSFFWYRGSTSGNFYWVEFDLETEYQGQSLDKKLYKGVNCATPNGIFSQPCREVGQTPLSAQEVK